MDAIWKKLSPWAKNWNGLFFQKSQNRMKIFTFFLQMHLVLRGFGNSSTSHSILKAESQNAQKSKSGRLWTFLIETIKRNSNVLFWMISLKLGLKKIFGHLWSCDHSPKSLTFKAILFTHIYVHTLWTYTVWNFIKIGQHLIWKILVQNFVRLLMHRKITEYKLLLHTLGFKITCQMKTIN